MKDKNEKKDFEQHSNSGDFQHIFKTAYDQLEIAKKVGEHPAAMMGAAVLAGIVVGSLSTNTDRSKKHKKNTALTDWISSEFGDEIQTIKDIALTALLRSLQEKIKTTETPSILRQTH